MSEGHPSTLVIGIGNPLRGDDGAGPRVVEILRPLAEAHTGELELIEAHSLLPELAERMAAHEATVLVDADLSTSDLVLEPLEPDAPPRPGSLGHAMGVHQLVALARELYGFHGTIHLCRIPAARFELGTHLSPACERATRGAAELVRSFVERS